MRFILACALVVGAAAAHPQTMYKCIDQAGKTAYQSSPCPDGSTEVWAKESTPQGGLQPAESSDGDAASSSERKQASRFDWRTAAKEHQVEGFAACRRPVENLAINDFEWTDGWLDLKFSQYASAGRPDVVVFIGDKIKYQNGFGGWIPHTYRCEYNVRTGKVENVTASPGRIR